MTQGQGPARVHAASAADGASAWTAALRGSQPQVLALVAAGTAVIVEAGHDIGQPPGAVGPVVSSYIALNLATGKQLWTVPAWGQFQSPPVAVAGNLVLTEGPAGVVVARTVATGAIAWTHSRPAACPAFSSTMGTSPLGLAADGPLAVASFGCGQRVVVQRLETATGRPVWTWTSPPTVAGAQPLLSATAAARQGSLVLLSGQVAPAPAAAAFTAALPRPYQWPAKLGPADQVSTVLAVDAATGHPRWSELGGQQETFALTGGTVCEVVTAGLECRDDATGRPALSALVTGQGPAASPPYIGDQQAGVAGGIAAFTVAPLRPGNIIVRAVKVRGGATAGRAHLAIGTTAYGGASYQVFVVASGLLPSGATLMLVRRVDAPGYPVVALEGPARP